jgi:hypothetical protein
MLINEFIFFLQVFVVLIFAFASLRIGKEALCTWVTLQAILANLFVLKQIDLCGFTVTCSDVFAIGSILGLNLLQEYFGKKTAVKTAWISFFFMLFFGLMSQIHLLFNPSPDDYSQSAFVILLSPAPRLLLASLIVFVIVQQFDLRFYGLLKKIPGNLPLSYRNFLSLSVSQFIDTVLFSFLGLYGVVASLFDVVFISFLLKVVITLCISACLFFSKRLIPLQDHHESL